MKNAVGLSLSTRPQEFEVLIRRADAFFEAATAENTRRAYDIAWRCFAGWCASNKLSAMPASPASVALYLASLADTHKVASLKMRLAAISVMHRANGHELDTKYVGITRVMRGIRRTNGSAVTKKQAATAEVLRDMIRAYASGETNKAKRDRAVLSIGFYAALRRSELSAINASDIAITMDGLVLTLPFRKTDQIGDGTVIGLPAKADSVICPVKAWQSWLAASDIISGPAFRSVNRGDNIQPSRFGEKDIARLIKSASHAAGYDPSLFSGHSLRAGFVTSAARAGVSEHLIMKQTGHKRLEEMQGYIRRAGLFSENAAAMI